ncbi:MAG: tetratricopeptide repeat protein, partial [bacterium]
MNDVRIFILLLLLLLIPFSTYSQAEKPRNPNSPVFKSYRPPVTSPLLEQSDATYQLWEGFRVQQKANAGDAVSQFELSIRYLTGRGFKADTLKAAYWTKKAAGQNHMLARFNLGIFQFNGWGTEWNPFDSYRNFRFAAERGMPDAQFILAQFLTENLVVPRDWNAAYKWVKLAADSGYVPAKESLKEFERRGYHSPSDTNRAGTPGDAPSYSGTFQLPFLNFSPDTIKQAPDSILVDDALKTAALSRTQKGETIADSVRVRNGKVEIDTAAVSHLHTAAEAGSP